MVYSINFIVVFSDLWRRNLERKIESESEGEINVNTHFFLNMCPKRITSDQSMDESCTQTHLEITIVSFFRIEDLISQSASDASLSLPRGSQILGVGSSRSRRLFCSISSSSSFIDQLDQGSILTTHLRKVKMCQCMAVGIFNFTNKIMPNSTRALPWI